MPRHPRRPLSSITPPLVALTLLYAAGPVLAGPPAAGAAAGPTPEQRLYAAAVDAAQTGDLARAEKLCRDLIAKAPDSPAAWGTLGQVLDRRGKRAEGIRAMQKAASLAPTYAPFWADLSAMQYGAGSDADAAASARQALKLDPKNPTALASLASALMRLKLYAEAVPALRRLSAVRGGLDEAVGRNLTFALLQTGDRQGALDMARKVAERFPGSVDAQSAYAELAGRGGDLSASYAALARAHKAAPNDVNTTLRYALVAGAVGKHAEAIATLGKLAAARPKDAAVHYHLGYLLLRDEGATAAERKRAEEELKTAVTLDPKKAEYVAQLGVARMLQGEQRFGEAQRAFDQALTLDPKSIPAHMGVATIAQNNKRWDAAAAAYRAALAVQPGNDYARRQLAGVLLSAGKRDEAYREFWDLATRNPKDTRYLKELGAYLLLDQNWQTARSAYQTVLERDPKDADAMVGVARTLEKEERGGEAEKMYLAAIAAQPKNPTAYYLLAERYETAKQPEKAKPLYEKLTAIDPENPSARWNLARYFMDKNTPEGDKRALEMMRQIRLRKGDPLRTDYMLGPATLMMARGRYDDAVTEVRKVLKAEPENIELQYALANALARAKQGDEAVEILQGLVKKAPRDEVAKAKGALAQAYEVLGRPDDAAKVYEEILAADALLAPARDALVNLRAAQNRPDAAAEFLERLALAGEEGPNMDAVNSVRELYTLGPKARPELYVAFAKRVAEKYPKRPEALGNAATAILKWNNPGASPGPAERQAALDLYRRAAEIDPKDPEARFQMALQLEALGKKDEAVAAFQETLRLDPNSQGAVNALKRLGVAAPAPSAAPGGGGANGGEKQGRQ